jgi:phosphoglycolate phosphatase-like HAD superfamily hydrolase
VHEEVVFVTDTLGDVIEGNEAGITVIAVDFGYHDREMLERGMPYFIVSNYNQLLKLILSIFPDES